MAQARSKRRDLVVRKAGGKMTAATRDYLLSIAIERRDAAAHAMMQHGHDTSAAWGQAAAAVQELLEMPTTAAAALNALRRTKTGGRNGGRPRTAPRCPCGAMTLKRAKQRNHRCAAAN